jgi:hypothetical protein
MVLVLARFESSTSTAKAEYEYEKPDQTGVHGHLNRKRATSKLTRRVGTVLLGLNSGEGNSCESRYGLRVCMILSTDITALTS